MIIDNGVIAVDEITIEELADDIEMLILAHGIEVFHISESFPKNGDRTYLLRGLTMEFEDDSIYCSDWDNILVNNFHVLVAFLRDFVLKIKRTITATERRGEIELKNGNITISVAMC